MKQGDAALRDPPKGVGRAARLAKSRRAQWRKLPIEQRLRVALDDDGEFGHWARKALALWACEEPSANESAMERDDKSDALLGLWAALDEGAMEAAERRLGTQEAWARVMAAKDRPRRPSALMALFELVQKSIKHERGRWAVELWRSMGLDPQIPTQGEGRWSQGWSERLLALKAAREAQALGVCADRQAPESAAVPRPRL